MDKPRIYFVERDGEKIACAPPGCNHEPAPTNFEIFFRPQVVLTPEEFATLLSIAGRYCHEGCPFGQHANRGYCDTQQCPLYALEQKEAPEAEALDYPGKW